MLRTLGAASIIAALIVANPAGAAPISYVATLLRENGSGVSGSAQLTLNGDLLTVHISATGLVPDQVHMSHIHGLLGAQAPSTMLPPPSADTDHDGYIESLNMEAARNSGPPIFDLPQTLSPKAYATAPGGVIDFTQTYNVTDTSLYDPTHLGLTLTPTDILGLTGGNTVPLIDRIIELHGENVPAEVGAGTTGEVHGQGGYIADVPVAGGVIRLAAVPEPATLMVLVTGLLGLGALRGRKLERPPSGQRGPAVFCSLESAMAARAEVEGQQSRQMQADVDRAIEILGAEAGCISGTIRELRRRMDALLDDLLPPLESPFLGQRVLHWMGLTARSKAAHSALSTLLKGIPFGADCIQIGSEESYLRQVIADALDNAYCVLLPHEEVSRAELESACWASIRKEGQKLIARSGLPNV